MKNKATRKLTWDNLARHLLAYLTAAFSAGIIIIAVTAIMEFFEHVNTVGKPGLLKVVFIMGLFLGAFYASLSGLFVLVGIAIGTWFDLRSWWFSALWGMSCTLLTARLFNGPGQNLDIRYYLTIALTGCLVGILYWLIAVRRSQSTKD